MSEEAAPRRIGVVSDTHGRTAALERALDVLRHQQIDRLVHCGDVGNGPEGRAVIDALAAVVAEGVPVGFVWGNTDYDRDDLARYAGHLGVDCLGDAGVIDAAGRQVAVTHGHLRDPFDPASFARGGPDYLLTGHTHVPHDHRPPDEPVTRHLNPGALHRAPVKTCGVLDVVDDLWKLLTADHGG